MHFLKISLHNYPLLKVHKNSYKIDPTSWGVPQLFGTSKQSHNTRSKFCNFPQYTQQILQFSIGLCGNFAISYNPEQSQVAPTAFLCSNQNPHLGFQCYSESNSPVRKYTEFFSFLMADQWRENTLASSRKWKLAPLKLEPIVRHGEEMDKAI